MSPPIVITGLGLVTPLGFGVKENWARLIAGDSAITVLEAGRFHIPVNLPVRLGAMIPRDRLNEAIRAAVPRGVWNTSTDVCHAWLLTALEALRHAQLPGAVDGKQKMPADEARVGIFVGNGAGSATFTEQEYANVYAAEKPAQRDISRMAVAKYMASSLASQLSILIAARGPSVTVNTACSSGATAIVLALDALRAGRIDRALAGGADLPLAGAVLKGFSNLGALSQRHDLEGRASRPFDIARDGFVLGEGAACLVLERADAAAARGATPLATLAGGSAQSEAHNLLSPQDLGVGMAACMADAMRDAQVSASSVCHVYTHGTATQYNDQCEAQALAATFAPGAEPSPTISATKALLGHTIGAAGAIDAVLATNGLVNGQGVPCRHLDTLDPQCSVEPARTVDIPGFNRNKRSSVLVNSFAFGGHNATLVLIPAG